MFPQWFGYELADLVIYSPRAYSALVQSYNQAIWPLHLLAVALIAGIAVLLWHRRQGGFRICMVLLAACWLWVAMVFFLQRYSVLHWAANFMALAFAVQALWLLIMAAWPTSGEPPWRSGFAGIAGAAVFAAGTIVPLAIVLYQDKPWTQLEMPGLMPGPTAITTLGVLILVRHKTALLAALIPLAWCMYSGALRLQ